MKVIIKTSDKEQILFLRIEQGYLASVTDDTTSYHVPETDILYWYKTLLFSEMVIDCTACDIRLYPKTAAVSQTATSEMTSTEHLSSISLQGQSLKKLLQTFPGNNRRYVAFFPKVWNQTFGKHLFQKLINAS